MDAIINQGAALEARRRLRDRRISLERGRGAFGAISQGDGGDVQREKGQSQSGLGKNLSGGSRSHGHHSGRGSEKGTDEGARRQVKRVFVDTEFRELFRGTPTTSMGNCRCRL